MYIYMYTIQNERPAIARKKYANQNTKYAISIKRTRQTKHQYLLEINL